jgi:hypothetical protein
VRHGAQTRRYDTVGLLVLRVIVGFLIVAQDYQKVSTMGPAAVGRGAPDRMIGLDRGHRRRSGQAAT